MYLKNHNIKREIISLLIYELYIHLITKLQKLSCDNKTSEETKKQQRKPKNQTKGFKPVLKELLG